MPNPLPLPTKVEEERRAWVTQHHEVVRLVKDCFGDRFSNNEIFDRLKISRRTGYRALGNDERIGKAPGRKPKISDDTIKAMIDYIEAGGCNDVGNVWKHLAERFATDCNPKTVQDAIKKSGFKNYRDTVKLEPLLNQTISDSPNTPLDESQAQHFQPAPQEPHMHHDQHSAIDPAFHQPSPAETLAHAIASAPESHVRLVLQEICRQYQDAAQMTSHYIYSFPAPPPMPHVPQLAPPQIHSRRQHPQQELQCDSASPDDLAGKRQRVGVCRRCNQQFDRTDNTMDKRNCLYHKGSPQRISREEVGALQRTPEAFIWSCCGGNGNVRGCCRAMHTTKKKRTYGKKRSATAAGLDGEEDSGVDECGGDDTLLESVNVGMGLNMGVAGLDPSNIDTRLQELGQASLQQQQQHEMLMHIQQMQEGVPLHLSPQMHDQGVNLQHDHLDHHGHHDHHQQQGLQAVMDPGLQSVDSSGFPVDVHLQLAQSLSG